MSMTAVLMPIKDNPEGGRDLTVIDSPNADRADGRQTIHCTDYGVDHKKLDGHEVGLTGCGCLSS